MTNHRAPKNFTSSNLKYLTRCYYYGRLQDIEYVSGATVLLFQTYTSTEYYGTKNLIRIYVPTDIDNDMNERLVTNENYFVIAAPYRLSLGAGYKHRVDMLLHIFREV